MHKGDKEHIKYEEEICISLNEYKLDDQALKLILKKKKKRRRGRFSPPRQSQRQKQHHQQLRRDNSLSSLPEASFQYVSSIASKWLCGLG